MFENEKKKRKKKPIKTLGGIGTTRLDTARRAASARARRWRARLARVSRAPNDVAKE